MDQHKPHKPLRRDQNNKPFQEQGKQLNAYSRFSSIAIQMFAIIGLGTYAGVKLDEYFPNNHKSYTISLSLSSVILAVVFVIKRIIASSKEDNANSKK